MLSKFAALVVMTWCVPLFHYACPPKAARAARLDAPHAELTEVRRVLHDLPAINATLNKHVFSSFYISDTGRGPQFRFVTDAQAWRTLPLSTRRLLVAQGGWIFYEVDQVWRSAHDGKVCLPKRDQTLTFQIVNGAHAPIARNASVIVARSEC